MRGCHVTGVDINEHGIANGARLADARWHAAREERRVSRYAYLAERL